MKPTDVATPAAPRRHRYLVHLFCAHDVNDGMSLYIAHVRPWAAHSGMRQKSCERIFIDECELISTINPMLPHGSDIRDVIEHIEAPGGFYYLLPLSVEQALQLGWPSRG